MELLTSKLDNIQETVNSQGYRCPEWNDCDWNNSILMLGAEEVFGPGVDEEFILPRLIESKLDIPVINLGFVRSSPTFHWVNSIRLVKENIKPIAVIYVWPDPIRYSEFVDASGVIVENSGHWTTRTGLGLAWARHKSQGKHFLRYLSSSCKLMWNSPSFHYSSASTDIEHITSIGPQIDADKNSYPQTKSHRMWAGRILDDIKL